MKLIKIVEKKSGCWAEDYPTKYHWAMENRPAILPPTGVGGDAAL